MPINTFISDSPDFTPEEAAADTPSSGNALGWVTLFMIFGPLAGLAVVSVTTKSAGAAWVLLYAGMFTMPAGCLLLAVHWGRCVYRIGVEKPNLSFRGVTKLAIHTTICIAALLLARPLLHVLVSMIPGQGIMGLPRLGLAFLVPRLPWIVGGLAILTMLSQWLGGMRVKLK